MGLLAIMRYAPETYLYPIINHEFHRWLTQCLPGIVYHCPLYSFCAYRSLIIFDGNTLTVLFFVYGNYLWVCMSYEISYSLLVIRLHGYTFYMRLTHELFTGSDKCDE